MPRQWVGYDAARKQLTETPELPCWALPRSERDSSDGSGGNGSSAPTNGRSAHAVEASSSGGNGKNGGEMSLEQARATVLPFGTRDHPEWKGKSLAEVSSLNTDLIAWLATEFSPTSKGGTTVQRAARVMVEQAPVAAKAA